MATHHITIHCAESGVSVDPDRRDVLVGDTVIWGVDRPTATATIAFPYPGHVNLIKATGTSGQPPRGQVVSAPDPGDLSYEVAVSEPSWPVLKPATAQLIISAQMAHRKPGP